MDDERNPPEVAPEDPGTVLDPPGSRWLSAPDAATLIGHSERGARDWLDRYDIPYRATRPRRWSEAVILARLAALGERPRKIPEAAPELPRNSPEAAPEASGRMSEPIEAHFRTAGEPTTALVPFERVAELTAGLVERIGDLTRRNEVLALEVGQLRERTAGHGPQLAAKDETIAELRRRAEAAEAGREAAEGERDALRLQLAEASVPPVGVVAAQEAPEGPHARDTTPAAQRPLQGLWRRLRRRLAGE